ncbi:hypothetical protein [Novosphingobium sp.]|uniref:hypothetical protein n=1 Tax=Novosphingobium sp. TaxID=1874826 RepID=UPI00286E421D|nr:hypothetical protein [Novosphingobium sp.]
MSALDTSLNNIIQAHALCDVRVSMHQGTGYEVLLQWHDDEVWHGPGYAFGAGPTTKAAIRLAINNMGKKRTPEIAGELA